MPSQQVFDAKDGATYTTSNGAPVNEPYAAQRLGQVGPLLLQGMSRLTLNFICICSLVSAQTSTTLISWPTLTVNVSQSVL
jgi:hypothetical protein